MRTLAQSRAANTQHLVKLLDKDRALQAKEAAIRNRRLYEVGALVEKAGLLDLDTAALYGMLLANATERVKPNAVARWADAGEKALAPEEDARVVVVVEFPADERLTRQCRAALGASGLRENRLLGHWEGRVDFAEAEAVVVANGGTIRRARAAAAVQLQEVAE